MKVHLDTDFGGDIDDLCALALLLAHPDVEITGITTVCDEGGRRCGYAKYVLGLAGQSGIPVAAGVDVSLGRYRWYPGYYEEAPYWPEPIARTPNPLEDAFALLENSARQGATIIGIGPYTNLAMFDQRQPGRLARVPLVLMGFYVRPVPAGYPQWTIDTDWNVQSDVFAATWLLEHCSPTIVPCEITLQTSLRRSYLDRLQRAGSVGALIARQAEAFARDERYEERIGQVYLGLPDDLINFLHDPLACAVALGWPGATVETIPLRPETEGDNFLRAVEAPGGRPTRVVTKVDGAGFGDWWCETVAGG
jgi:inosine-uridine nucleoside N-ribohydrolase